MSILLDDVLSVGPLRGAAVVGGQSGVGWRIVEWVSVIHPPGADFAQPGELVLTTGVGCRSREFNRFVLDVASREAAGLAIAAPPGQDGPSVSDATLAAADEAQFPLLTLDWQVPFASITRAVINRLLEDRYLTQLDGSDRLLDRFSSTVLEGRGLSGLLEEIEACVDAGALLFDERWALLRAGALAVAQLDDAAVATLHRRSRGLRPDERARLDGFLGAREPTTIDRIEPLGLPGGVGIGVKVRHRPLGFLFLLGHEPRSVPVDFEALEARALRAGATALAIEIVQKHAQSAQVSRARDELLWDFLAQEGTPSIESVERVGRLGLDLRGQYEILVNDDPDPTARSQSVGGFMRVASRHGRACLSLDRDSHSAVLVARDGPCLRELLERTVTDEAATHWGIAAQPCALAELPQSYRAARLAVQVARALRLNESFADARALEPFMLLSGLTADPGAVTWARRTIDPLADYDEGTGRNLVETLQVYLEEGMNTSSAARRLHLNRHSLSYRLRKIEALTERSLASATDRFVLDLSVKLHRFGVLA